MQALQETSQALVLQVTASEERAARAEVDLRVERDLRQSIQEKYEKSREQISSLQLQVKQLNEDAKGHDRMRNELERVKKQWSEAQMTLEELGIQLSVSKLKVSELQERAKTNDAANTSLRSNSDLNSSTSDVWWTPDNAASKCKGCDREFSITRRKVINCHSNIVSNGLLTNSHILFPASLPQLWRNILQKLFGTIGAATQRPGSYGQTRACL